MNSETGRAKARDSEAWDIIKVVLHAILLAVVVRIFLFQPFNIPSGSMKETLLVGDYLFVSKYSYGYSRFSFPFQIIPFSGRVLEGKPERGDVAVFRLPRDTSTDYIKRVIGLPGERIQMLEGVLYINGKAVPKEPAGTFTDYDERGRPVVIDRYQETLPNGVKYYVLDAGRTSYDTTREFEVPPGHYFMMGDNRDNSQDSRATSAVGPVPIENFIGRAQMIFYSSDERWHWWEIWKAPFHIRWDRFFHMVR
ncbi:MAG: signal peptidase I [Hyphomicrobiaceae bacterium]